MSKIAVSMKIVFSWPSKSYAYIAAIGHFILGVLILALTNVGRYAAVWLLLLGVPTIKVTVTVTPTCRNHRVSS